MAGISKRFEQLLYKVSIKKSLQTIFITLFILPVILVSTFFIIYLYNTMLDWERENVKTSMKQTEEVFNSTLKEVQGFSDRIYLNKQLQDILLHEYTDIQQLYDDYASLSFLENYLLTFNQISNYRIYTDNQTLLDNSFIVKVDESIKTTQWYISAINLKGKSFWMLKKDEYSKKEYVCLIRSLWSSKDSRFYGVLVVNIDANNINKKLLTSIFNTAIFVNNQMVYSAFDNFSQEDVKALNSFVVNYEPDISKIAKVKFNNHRYGIMGESIIDPDRTILEFVIMYIIPMRELISATMKVLSISILIIVIMIVLSIVLINVFIDYLNSRVAKVQYGISSVVAKNFEIPPSIGGNDEFENIYENLFKMSVEIKSMIEEIYLQNIEKEQLATKQSEISFKMLSTQINPHFLFNTLETIRMKSISSGQKDVATMLKLLASLLRYNLSVKGQPVPLVQELEAVQNYLNIQHMRFEDRISYDIVTMCDVNDFMILPLLIQPLVENSFSHGLENKVSGGFIYIFINIEETDGKKILNIGIKDNGCGISSEGLAELNGQLEKDEENLDSTHIGIANVNSRIRLFYGKEYGLSIKSVIDEGTEVSIRIPV